jgi:glycosyltransferase involved in cell wall biosynthesis
LKHPLNIFIPHSSGLLTDHRSHGDGLVAHGFIQRLSERGHTLYVAAEAVDLQRPLPANVHIRQFGKENDGGPAYRLRYMRAIRAWYRELQKGVRFDVIHQLNPVFTGLSLALAGAREPLILGPFVAGWPIDPDSSLSGAGIISSAASRTKSWIAASQQKRASALLLTTPAAEDRIPFASALRDRIYALPHGLDTDFFSPLPGQPGSKAEDQDILFLSNLVARKGILDLVNAFYIVASDLPHARLIIAGDGPEGASTKELAEKLGIQDRIVFAGKQTRKQSLDLLRSCTIFCQPSHGEPYGMSAAEAMSCAKPLVVTREGGLGYLVDDNGGLRVPMKCPEELARALRSLLEDPARRAAMGEHNRSRAVSGMSWPKIIEKLEDVYCKAMERPAQA